MKHPLFAALFAFGTISAVPAAAQPAQSSSACLQEFNIRSWTVPDDQTLIVADQLHHSYKMSLKGRCTGLKFPLALRFQPFSGSQLSCLSKGDSVFVPPGGGLPGQRCYVNDVQPYTPEMQHADAVAKAMEKSQ